MTPKRLLSRVVLIAVTVLGARHGVAQVVLSEFMAVNRSTLQDEDGEYSDWIEVYNAANTAVSLGGWYLTDASSELTKWRFPENVELGPRNFLLVFCSGKDRVDPARSLHTNFSLNGEGEFLALVQADGVTVASQFAPEFRNQLPDVSYGFAQQSVETTILSAGSLGRVFVPMDDILGTEWVEPTFDDSFWTEGTSGFGYDQKSVPTYLDLIQTDIGSMMRDKNATAYIRMHFEVTDPSILDLLQLRMKYEDGFVAYLNGVEVARSNAPSELQWNSRSEGAHSQGVAVVFEDHDITRFKHLLRPMDNVLAVQGLNATMTSTDFFVLPEIVGVTIGELQTEIQFFDNPTPAWTNGVGFTEVSRAPEFEVAGGVYVEEVEVELVSPANGATIHITTDGSEPSRASPIYRGPLKLTATSVVKAKAVELNLLPSPTAEQVFVLIGRDLGDFTSNLPLVVVNAFADRIGDTITPAHFHVIGRDGAERTALTAEPHFVGRGGIKTIESSYADQEKPSFAIEIWDEEGEEQRVGILGLPADSEWILQGPHDFDRALIRNAFMYELSNRIGRYAPKSRFVEVLINSGDRSLSVANYSGVYLLAEKVKRGPERVDVERLSPADAFEPMISGGYILQIDRPEPGADGFFTKRGTPHAVDDISTVFTYVYPDDKNLNGQQRSWVQGYLNGFESVLYGSDFQDPQFGYAQYIDTGSFIDHHILNELGKNPHGLHLGTFLFKKRNGKLEAGPIWDFERSMAPADDSRASNPIGWYDHSDYEWWGRLAEDPSYRARYRSRWRELRENHISVESMHATIDRMADELREAQVRNFQRWPLGLGVGGWEGQIGRIKEWLSARVAWIDSQLLEAPIFSRDGDESPPSIELRLINPNGAGDILYTVNGPDPMLADGETAAEASIFEESLSLNENSRVRARVRIGTNMWSTLSEEIYVVSQTPLAITEVMYNPPGGTAFEFLEILNYGDETVNLRNFSFGSGIDLDFGEAEIESKGFGVVVSNEDAFGTLYGDRDVRIVGQYSGSLSDRGETIALLGPVSETIVEFRYSDEWYQETDGIGHSLTLVDPRVPLETLSQPASWRPSLEPNGSPGQPDVAEEPGGQVPGDSNQDGRLNVTDAVDLIHFLFRGGTGGLPCARGKVQDIANILFLDSNADLSIDAADVVYNLTYLFLGGPPPAAGTGCMVIFGCPDVCSL